MLVNSIPQSESVINSLPPEVNITFAEELIAIGRDIERRVLAKAVKLYADDKIFIVGKRTVVFS